LPVVFTRIHPRKLRMFFTPETYTRVLLCRSPRRVVMLLIGPDTLSGVRGRCVSVFLPSKLRVPTESRYPWVCVNDQESASNAAHGDVLLPGDSVSKDFFETTLRAFLQYPHQRPRFYWVAVPRNQLQHSPL
jgi:hypothetical protein